MPKPSPRSQLLLLSAEGQLESLPLRPGPFGGGFVVLARERCLFERLDVTPSLSARAALAAARIHAQTATPYQLSGSIITRQGNSFGMWFWDAAWVGEKLEAAGLDPDTRILPETMVRAPGVGWRVVKASTGYEAQLWKGNFLMADGWRRRPYDEAAWADFVRVQGGDASGEGAVLAAQTLPYTLQSPYRRSQLSTWTPDRVGVAAAFALGVVLAGAIGLFGGQAVALHQHTEQVVAETAAVHAASPQAQAKLKTDIGNLSAIRTEVDAPDAMVLLKAAQDILTPMNVQIAAFTVDRTKAHLILPQQATNQVGAIAAALDKSPQFDTIVPKIDAAKGRLIIDMAVTGARVSKKKVTATRTVAATPAL